MVSGVTQIEVDGLNNKRRALLESAKEYLSKAANIIEMASEQESDCMDNLPESLQGSERYEKMESAIGYLEEALEHTENAKDCITEAVS